MKLELTDARMIDTGMTDTGMTDTNTTEDFPALFRQYIQNSLQATLLGFPQDAGVLPAELRDRAWHVLSFALKMAEVWPATRDLLLLLAPKLEQAGHRDDWLPYLAAGLKLSQVCGDARTAAELGLQAGHLHYLCSRFDLANEQFKTSLVIFRTLGDTRGQARTYNELAWLDHLQHRYAEATDHVEQALALLDEADPERAMCYRVQGMIAIDQRRWQEGELFHQKALALFEKEGERRRIAGSMQNLAYALRVQKKFKEALFYCQQAVTILNQLADAHSLAIAYMTLGSIYYNLSKPSDAIVNYKQAENIFNRLQDKLSIAKILTGLGLGYLGVHEYLEAANSFMLSIRLFAELQDESLRLNATDGLVMTYLASKEYVKAIKVAKQALDELPNIANAPNYDYLLHYSRSTWQKHNKGRGKALNDFCLV